MLLKRIGYYLVGVSMGSIFVYFLWSKKDATFDYGMDARTLKSIRTKKRIYSEEAKKVMENSNIDTLQISTVLYVGDIDFSNSKPRQKPCAEYFVKGKRDVEHISLYVSRCDSTATIEKIFVD